MPDLLLELFSEEIPARMQGAAAKELERLVVGALTDRGLLFEGARSFAGPRRLTLAVIGLPAKQADVTEEKKGPRVGAPEKAIEGFLKSAGVSLAQCETRSDGKGEFYVAVLHRKGRATEEVLAEILPEAIAKLPWPKSMRWGEGTFRWVRPIHSIVATFDGEVVSFEMGGVMSGRATRGHRFLSAGPIDVRRLDDYLAKLKAAHVIADASERREIVLHEAKQKAFALGLELIEDEGLLHEVSGLVEWPVVLVGEIDEAFMDVPPEILQTSMRTHQKYFSLRPTSFEARPAGLAPQDDGFERDGRRPEVSAERTSKGGVAPLANKFVVVANMIAEDGGKEIVAGNERVLRARLSDAKFFWEQDKKRSLESRVADLEDIVFHAKLGTQLERVKRIEALAGKIAKIIGADVEKATRAALLCKADLTTGVVGEFPELQGIMGRYYALDDGEDREVANAIRDHYKPLGPSDAVPLEQVSVAVALADKLDTLVGFFAINEKPSGSADPYALRRAALGIIRIILDNQIRINLVDLIFFHTGWLAERHLAHFEHTVARMIGPLSALAPKADVLELERKLSKSIRGKPKLIELVQKYTATTNELLTFLAERLKVVLRTNGTRHDIIGSVLVPHRDFRLKTGDPEFAWGTDDLISIVRRVEALQAFLKTDDGANLLTGYRRAANILKIEEKKDKRDYRGVPDGLAQDEEIALQRALTHAKVEMAKALKKEDFADAMRALSQLRVPVDRFFDKVTVNAEDKALRENRLKLLSQIVETAHHVADFSRIEG